MAAGLLTSLLAVLPSMAVAQRGPPGWSTRVATPEQESAIAQALQQICDANPNATMCPRACLNQTYQINGCTYPMRLHGDAGTTCPDWTRLCCSNTTCASPDNVSIVLQSVESLCGRIASHTRDTRDAGAIEDDRMMRHPRARGYRTFALHVTLQTCSLGCSWCGTNWCQELVRTNNRATCSTDSTCSTTPCEERCNTTSTVNGTESVDHGWLRTVDTGLGWCKTQEPYPVGQCRCWDDTPEPCGSPWKGVDCRLDDGEFRWHLKVDGNPQIISYPLIGLLGCDVQFYETDGGKTCTRCQSTGVGVYVVVAFAGFLAATILLGLAIYHVASSAWRPSNRPGAECVVHCGRYQSASKAVQYWHDALATHLDVASEEVAVDRAFSFGLQVFDEVQVVDTNALERVWVGNERLGLAEHHQRLATFALVLIVFITFYYNLAESASAGGNTSGAVVELHKALRSMLYLGASVVFCKLMLVFAHIVGLGPAESLADWKRRAKDKRAAKRLQEERDGLSGSVLQVNQEAMKDKVLLSLREKPGRWMAPTSSLRKLPPNAGAANQTPALCFCVTDDWAAATTKHLSCTLPDGATPGNMLRIDTGHQDIDLPVPDDAQPGTKILVTTDDFVDDCIHTLVRRSGASDTLLHQQKSELVRAISALRNDQIENLTDGAIFVLCGKSVANSASVDRLRSLLQLRDEQIVTVKRHGSVEHGDQDELRHKTAALNSLDVFLATHRHSTEHLSKQTAFKDAMDETLGARDALTGAGSQRAVQQAASQLGSLVKIVTAQLQQSFAFLNLSLEWPLFLRLLSDRIGSWIRFDFPQLVPIACIIGGGSTKQRLAMLAWMFVAVPLPIFILRERVTKNRRKWESVHDEAAAARAAHQTNFGWALFTLLSPIGFGVIADVFYRNVTSGASALTTMGCILLASPIVVLLPGYAFGKLKEAQGNGTVHSRAFESRLGWLCARYRAKCAWWELLYLEARFATTAAGAVSKTHPLQSTAAIVAITALMLLAQLVSKPFLETAEEAQHWSSNNRMAVIGYVCQLIVLGTGTLSLYVGWEEDSDVSIAEAAVSAFTALAILTPFAISMAIVYLSQAAAEIDEQDGREHDFDEGSFDDNPLRTSQEEYKAADANEAIESIDLDNLEEVKSVVLVNNTTSEDVGGGLEYTTLAKVTVRQKQSVKSPEVRIIAPNEVVLVREEAYSDGHHRGRIGDSEWVSIESRTGKVLMRPGRHVDQHAGAYKVITRTPVNPTFEPPETVDEGPGSTQPVASGLQPGETIHQLTVRLTSQTDASWLQPGEMVHLDQGVVKGSHLRGRIVSEGWAVAGIDVGRLAWCSIKSEAGGVLCCNMLKTCPGESASSYVVVADATLHAGVAITSAKAGQLAAGLSVDVYEVLESPPGAQGHSRGRVSDEEWVSIRTDEGIELLVDAGRVEAELKLKAETDRNAANAKAETDRKAANAKAETDRKAANAKKEEGDQLFAAACQEVNESLFRAAARVYATAAEMPGEKFVMREIGISDLVAQAESAAEQLVSLNEQSEQFMQVVCPAGSGPGAFVAVNAPDGQQLQVQVPQSVVPGMPFSISFSPSGPATMPPIVPGLQIVATATVRSGPHVSGKEVGQLRAGEFVRIMEERQEDGHQRVRIGKRRWISRTVAGGKVLAVPALVTAGLQIVATATVRSGPHVSSKEVGQLRAGEFVRIMEERQEDGHQRVRIGKRRWISRTVASGKALAVPADVSATSATAPLTSY